MKGEPGETLTAPFLVTRGSAPRCGPKASVIGGEFLIGGRGQADMWRGGKTQGQQAHRIRSSQGQDTGGYNGAGAALLHDKTSKLPLAAPALHGHPCNTEISITTFDLPFPNSDLKSKQYGTTAET